MKTRMLIHQELCNEMHRLYLNKNADYGSSFQKVRAKIPNAILVRLNDKLNRLESLMGKDEEERKVKSESIDDTLMDIANYALLELVERRWEDQIDEEEEDEEKEDEESSSFFDLFSNIADGLREILEENAANNKKIEESCTVNGLTWKKEVDIHTVVTSTYRPKYKNYRVVTTVIRNGDVVAQEYVS